MEQNMNGVPRQLFGCKLGLVLGSAGPDKVRYVIVYKCRPIKEMMVRYGMCHRANSKEHITKEGSIVMIKIDSGLFGLDESGMLRYGHSDALQAPTKLKFDGFKGIELLEHNKYRLWVPNFEEGKWVPAKQWMVRRVKAKELGKELYWAAGWLKDHPHSTDKEMVTRISVLYKKAVTVAQVKKARAATKDIEERLCTYYPFKESLLPMPSELLHDRETILIPAIEAVEWMKTWIKRMQGDKIQIVDDAQATLNDLGSGVNRK